MDDSEQVRRIHEVRQAFAAKAPQGMNDDDDTRLAMIVTAAGHLPFPQTREQVVDAARTSGDENLATQVRSLPDGARYDSLDDLLLAMGVGKAGRIDVPGAPPGPADQGPPIPS